MRSSLLLHALARSRRSQPARLAGVLLLTLCLPQGAVAQHDHADHAAGETPRWSLGAGAVPLLTHVSPLLAGESRSEVDLTQPTLGGHLSFARGRAELHGMLNLEGVTLRRGELNPGIWGEGYVDRRHPHTFLHELMFVVRPVAPAGLDVSLAAGKGFVPFGTDDPMVRPFVKFPANHHYAQILERLVAIAALRAGPATVEVAAFNGDEPTDPADLPNVRRFGDSWAVRGTVRPSQPIELSASHARVTSPEHPIGGLLDQRKWSVAARYEHEWNDRKGAYGLAEWARTGEYDEETEAFAFSTWLVEGALRRSGTEVAVRVERTERPEGERLIDPFRAPVPHHDLSILGTTRWTTATLAVRVGAFDAGPVHARPFLEAQRLHARPTDARSLFEPAEFYGARRLWTFSAGLRLSAGALHARMGRYGAALAAAGHDHGHGT